MAEHGEGQRPEGYKPGQDMGLALLAALQAAGERGEYAELQAFYEFMEGADPVIKAVIQQRRDALCACEWEIRPLVTKLPEATGKQVAFLRDAFERVTNLADAVAHLATAFFRGFAHLEKVFTREGMVLRLDPVPQRFWARDVKRGMWQHNEHAAEGRLSGQAMERKRYIVLETSAADRMVSVLYLRKTLCKAEWYEFQRLCGLPAVYAADGPDASAGGAGTAEGGPAGTTSDFRCPVRGGRAVPFIERIERFDQLMVLAMTKRRLGSLPGLVTAPAGGASSHQVFRKLASEDAAAVSKVFQEQFDAPLLEKFFPGQPVLAEFVTTPRV